MAYGFMAMPLAFAGLPLYIHIPDYYTRTFGIDLGALALCLMIIRLLDGIQDPLIGYYCDKYAGLRRHAINWGVILLVAGMSGLYLGPTNNDIALAWFSVAMILATTGFSILMINLTTIGGLWHSDQKVRISISIWRESFGLIGLLTAAILPTLLMNRYSDQITFAVLLGVFAILLILALVQLHPVLRKIPLVNASNTSTSGGRFAFFSILNGTHRRFFVLCLVSYIAASLPAVLTLFFIRDYLGGDAYSGVFLALYFVSGAIFMGVWNAIARRQSAVMAWLIAHIIAIVSFAGAIFLGPNDLFWYGAICVFTGATVGADLSFPPALLADRIEKFQNKAQATQHYAVLSFLPKFALAVATAFALGLLDMAGFKAGQENSDAALATLIILYAGIPCILKSISGIMIWRLLSHEDKNEKLHKRNIGDGTARIS
jgi:GPH family glycoside/pentoside/hexuronide:cation symporter